MSNIGDSEKRTQKRVIKFFREQLHYKYLGDLHDSENSNIIKGKLKIFLKKKGYSDKLIDKAIAELKEVSTNLQHGLYSANKSVYSLLKYGAKVRENIGEANKTIQFIDFDNPQENYFYIAEEVTIVGNNVKRPDIVIYINGIAVAVIELKKSSVSVSNGIRQNLTNQKSNFIEKFFTTMQFCMAGNYSEGLRYGTLLTPEKYFLEWKDDGFKEFQDERDETDVLIEEKANRLSERFNKELFSMFYKRRLLDLIHNFVIFDKGIKKVCRYNQYYAIKRTQTRLMNKNKGGIVWHTQGSGKSLSMVWLSKWLLSNISDARMLIVTDREELDDQIEKTYIGVDEKIVRTRSGRDLIEKLNSYENRLICSLVHKFGRRDNERTSKDYDKYVEEIKASLPSNFAPKGKIYIFVDECHRTQSGKLHDAMKAILPNSILIGFTGTPLLKKDKATSLEVFGGYIHTYKFNEGVKDGVILDLRYEARDIPQDITSQYKIDVWFDIKTEGLTIRAKAKLKARWGNMQKIFSSRSRLEKIASDIIFDMGTKTRLMNGKGNAILIAGSVYSACKYYEIFISKGFKKCAIITSYNPQAGDLRTDTVNDEEDTETFEKYTTYKKMLNGQVVEDFEKEAKRKFVEEPANMKLLIVVDKLLTGFDAPPCTFMYIDKAMHDHGLFQAICRVNRLDGETKDFGYIVDYKELFGDLADAMGKYTSKAFEAYDTEDIEGLIKDRSDEAKSYFDDTLEELNTLCEGVEMPQGELEYIHYFCGENGIDNGGDEILARIREKLYKLVNRLIRGYAEVKPLFKSRGYTEAAIERIDKKVVFYISLKETIGRASGDFIDLKAYEPGMRYLIDNYISADEAKKIGEFDDFTLLDFIVAQEAKFEEENNDKDASESAAEAIENNIRKKIVERNTVNPKYFEKMSAVLEKLILDRRKGVIAYKELLDMYMELAKNVENPENNTRYPSSMRDSAAKRAIYDNCGEYEELAIDLHNAVMISKMDGFRNNPVKENKIKRELYRILKDQDEVERIFKIIVEQEEY